MRLLTVLVPVWLVACSAAPDEEVGSSQQGLAPVDPDRPSEPGDPAAPTDPPIIGGTPDTCHPQTGYLAAGDDLVCSLVLIAPNVVLTAAHCVNPAATNVRVGFGTMGGTTYGIDKVYVHPDFKVNRPTNDVAVLVLSSTVSGITPATLVDLPAENTSATASGYGNTLPRGQSSSIARKLPVTLTTNEERALEVMPPATGTTCDGDSGGPIYANNPCGQTGQQIYGTISQAAKGRTGCAVGESGSGSNVQSTRDFVTKALAGTATQLASNADCAPGGKLVDCLTQQNGADVCGLRWCPPTGVMATGACEAGPYARAPRTNECEPDGFGNALDDDCDGEIDEGCLSPACKGVTCPIDAECVAGTCECHKSCPGGQLDPETCTCFCVSACQDGVCECGENASTCPQDCGAPASWCGDGTCDPGELGCATDCGPSGWCGDGTCSSHETYTCPIDCSAATCGDNFCDFGEDTWSCPNDCGTFCSAVCGDNVCECGETTSSCAYDCGGGGGGGGGGDDPGGTCEDAWWDYQYGFLPEYPIDCWYLN